MQLINRRPKIRVVNGLLDTPVVATVYVSFERNYYAPKTVMTLYVLVCTRPKRPKTMLFGQTVRNRSLCMYIQVIRERRAILVNSMCEKNEEHGNGMDIERPAL